MFKRILAKYNETTDLNKFLIKGIALFMAWRVFRKWMLLNGEQTEFTHWFATIYLKVVGFLLSFLAFDPIIDYPSRSLWLEGSTHSIYVAYDCLGVNLFFIFLIFIVAYPGLIKHRIQFVISGFLIIFLLNSMRMAALAWIVSKWPEKMDFYHHFVFQGVIFAAIFAMWFMFSQLNQKKNELPQTEA